MPGRVTIAEGVHCPPGLLDKVTEAHLDDYNIKYDGHQVELTPVLPESLAVREFRKTRAMGGRALEKTTEVKED